MSKNSSSPKNKTVTEEKKSPDKKWLLLLAATVLLALFLRVLWLTQSPRGALIDEAHFGYIAYSLINTGKDEHGISWPLIFKGFGDEKLPAYGYALVPVIKLFGLSNFTIRVPSVIAGTLLVIIMYVLVTELGFSRRAGLWAAFLTAVSPWPFFLSRFGFESNLALFFFGLALVFLAKMFKSTQQKWAILAGLFFGLTWYAYIAYRPITIIIPVLLFAFAWWQKKLTRKQILTFFITLIIVVAPFLMPGASSSNTQRFKQVGILSDGGMVAIINEKRSFCDMRLPRLMCYVVWNKPGVISATLLTRFFETFSPQYLATRGEDGLFFLNVSGYGQFFFVLYPFFLLGLIFTIANFKSGDSVKISPLVKALLILGLMLAPVPSLLAGDAQKVRLTPLYPFMLITYVIGIELAFEFISHKVLRQVFQTVLVLAVLGTSFYYYVNYYTVHTIKHDDSYQSYLPDLMSSLSQYNEDTQIYIRPFFSDPLMFYAYYTHMDPAEYQKNAVLGELEGSGFQHTVKLKNLEIKDDSLVNIACKAAAQNKPTLYVSNIREPDGRFVKDVRSENGALGLVYVYDALWFGQKYPEKCAQHP
jgi:4-amino-4-deoxy-L-arabinose transferase-like glycosyltransferase